MNTKNIKMFFFDNDSTLFDHKYNGIRPKTFEALKLLKKNGYKLCMNTSRSYAEMTNVPKEVLDLMDCLILLDGAYIIKDGDVEVSYINKERVLEAIKFFDKYDFTYRYCTDDGNGYLNKHDEDKENLFYRLYEMIPPIKKYEGEEVIHLLSYVSEEHKDELLNIFKEEDNSLLRIAIETAPVGCNKGLAMLKVAKEYGYKQEELCAVGDSDNDKDMLKLSALGIAMGNCQDSLRLVADYITDDIADEGLYNAMKHFNFI